MIPLWVLSFSKCSAGSAIQLWTGHYISQGIARLAIDTCVARLVRKRQCNRVIPTFRPWWHYATAKLVSCPLLPQCFGSKKDV